VGRIEVRWYNYKSRGAVSKTFDKKSTPILSRVWIGYLGGFALLGVGNCGADFVDRVLCLPAQRQADGVEVDEN